MGKVLRKKGRFPEGSIVFEVETYSCVCVGGGRRVGRVGGGGGDYRK